MRRESYINLRRRNDWLSIAYAFYKEHGGTFAPETFQNVLALCGFDVEGFLAEQDAKYNVVITTFNNRVIDIQ